MRHALSVLSLLLGPLLLAALPAHAQSGLSRAVLELPSTLAGENRQIDGRLYGGAIVATIGDRDGDAANFESTDLITFAIGPRGGPASLRFTGPRASQGETEGFEAWAQRNASALLAILFPSDLGSSVLGRSAGELHAQQFLLTTALDTESIREAGPRTRAGAGGLIEFERLGRDDSLVGDSGWAAQGLYNVNRTFAVQGRFASQRESFTTQATTISADYHPYIEIDGDIRWRIGATARGGFLYSQADTMDLGSLEFGGGGWVSGFKDLGRVRIGGGTMVQGSKSYVPSVSEGFDFLADAINDRGVHYDVSVGGTVGIDTSSRTAVIVKVLDHLPVSSRDTRPDSWLLLTGLSYRFGLPSLNFGYKMYSTDNLRAHSLFLQGNFNW
jgi:hypothetical protein